MRGGKIGGICFLAFLLCVKAEELTIPEELKTVVSESNSVLGSQEDEIRSGALAESSAFSDGGSSQSEAMAESSGGSSLAQSVASSHGGSAQSKAITSSDADAQASSTALGNNRGYPFRVPGSSSAQATAEAQASSSSGFKPQNSYPPVYPSSIPSSVLSPYSSGLAPYSLNPSSSSQAEAEAQASSGSSFNPSPYSSSPHGTGSNSAQAQAEADAQVSGPAYYNQGYSPYTPSPFSSGLSPLSGSNVAQAEADAQAISGRNLGLGMSPLLPSQYGVGSSSAQARAEAQLNQGVNSYGQGMNPYSPYGSSNTQSDSLAQVSGGTENLYSPLSGSGSPHGLRSQAQAQALSMSQTMGGWGNRFNSGLSPSYLYGGPNTAQAQAQADAQANGGTNYYNPYSSYTPYSPGSSSAQADATAQSNSMNSPIKPVLSPYVPSSFNPSSSSASAKADSQASNGGVSPYISGLNPYYPSPQLSPNPSGSSSASASAEATANGAGGFPYSPSVPLVSGYPLSLKGPTAQSLAEAQAQSSLGGNQYGPGLLPSGYYNPGSVAQSQADASAQASSNSAASASASANTFVGVKSRALQPNEYIYPYNYGADSGLFCKRFQEIIYLSSPDGVCMVCFCMKDFNKGALYPMCASCAICQAPDPLPPPLPPPPAPFPEPYSIVTTPLPIPEVAVTCSPLPSGKPFTNPLNPCQLCICREATNVLGKPDVHIECQENPQCVLPPDVTPFPPVPDLPIPIPLPLCEKFPTNVLFPHPNDMCRLCKCSLELSEYGLPERQITCYPNPDCIPRPAPPPEPMPPYETITAPPMPYPFPPDPRPAPPPFPEPVTIEPINSQTNVERSAHNSAPSTPINILVPWPPVTTPTPPAPGPLPGPSPHESCRPFPPNQPFQHPWDDCQVCVCSEAYATGLITVEVNCFTKKSCCIEPPDNYIPVTLPPPTPYPIPGTIVIADNICEFKTFGVEFRNPDNNCQVCACLPNNGVVSTSCKQLNTPECLSYSGSSASAEAQASADSGTFNGLVPFSGSGTYRPSSYSPFGTGAQSQSSAEANAVIPNSQSTYYFPGQYQGRPKVYPGSPADVYPGSQADAQAQALTQSQGYGQSSATAEAEANANTVYQPYSSNLTPGNYINSGLGVGNNLGSSSSADAQAQLQSIRFKYPSYRGYDQGQALANALSGLNYNQYSPRLYQGVPASVLYPSLYTRPSHEVTPLYQPGQFRDASAQAQAQSSSSGSSGQSQAAASAAAGGRYQTKSGYPEDDLLD